MIQPRPMTGPVSDLVAIDDSRLAEHGIARTGVTLDPAEMQAVRWVLQSQTVFVREHVGTEIEQLGPKDFLDRLLIKHGLPLLRRGLYGVMLDTGEVFVPIDAEPLLRTAAEQAEHDARVDRMVAGLERAYRVPPGDRRDTDQAERRP